MNYEAYTRNGLILSDDVRPFVSERNLRRDLASGTLVKVRRGAFVEASRWSQLNAREQHIVRVQAVVTQAKRPVIVAGTSAAALWNMPITGAWPHDVTLLANWNGGGRSDPGVRRSSVGADTARTVTIRGLKVTNLARTTLDVARPLSFTDAIGSVDWAILKKNTNRITVDDLVADLSTMNPRTGRAHLQQLIEFASPLSDSFYESAARAAIHLLGFAAPELQVRLSDAKGEMIPDFLWRDVRVLGEFDGKVKYTRNEYSRGDPAEVAWREKKREDRLRALNYSVVRILTKHVNNPVQLELLLTSAGVPRR